MFLGGLICIFASIKDVAMKEITIENRLKEKCLGLKLSCIEADVQVHESGTRLQSEIGSMLDKISGSLKINDISSLPAIADSRKAYKSCGKDPARYRLSAEALLRRVVSGKGLYQINNVVDQLNLVSVSSGYSIGGYDADSIVGKVSFGIGKEDEPYEGIGRGVLNIQYMPVFRDEIGAFGTPTSDSERTKVTNETKRFLMIIIDYSGGNDIDNATDMAVRLLSEYCDAKSIEITNID